MESGQGGWDTPMRWAGILLGSAFVLGFTTVAGAISTAGQLRGAGLTASEAIGALPRSYLLTHGADRLIPWLIVAAGAASVAYVFSLAFADDASGLRGWIAVVCTALAIGAIDAQRWLAGAAPEQAWRLAWWGALGVVGVGILALVVVGRAEGWEQPRVRSASRRDSRVVRGSRNALMGVLLVLCVAQIIYALGWYPADGGAWWTLVAVLSGLTGLAVTWACVGSRPRTDDETSNPTASELPRSWPGETGVPPRSGEPGPTPESESELASITRVAGGPGPSPSARLVTEGAPAAATETETANASRASDRDTEADGRPPTRPVVCALLAATIVCFGTALGYPRSFAHPEARPAAVELRASHRVITGAWIAASGDWVYLGQLQSWDGSDRHGHTLSIPKSDVAAYAYGRLEPLPLACSDLEQVRGQVLEAVVAPSAISQPTLSACPP